MHFKPQIAFIVTCRPRPRTSLARVLLGAGSLSDVKKVNSKPSLTEFKMAAVKPDVEVTFERLKKAT